MAQEIKIIKSQETHCYKANANDDVNDVEETVVPSNKTLKGYATHVMHRVASTRIGQVLIEKVDRVLKILEETAKWSLPQDDSDDLQLERPLPWFLFLPLIIWLRVFRIYLSIGSYVMRSQPITPLSIMSFIQNKRSQLKALRVKGLKSMENKEVGNKGLCSPSQNASLVHKFRNLLSSAICIPGQYREVPAKWVFVEPSKEEVTKEMSVPSTKRSRDDDSFELNLTVQEMLDKYANENSDSDSDYVPKEDEEDEDDSDNSSTKTCSSIEGDLLEESPENSLETTIDAEESESKDKENNENVEAEPVKKTDNEELQTFKEMPAKENCKNNETNLAPTEVAPPQNLSTPKSNAPTYLTVPLDEENQQKSTPGHETAASMKPPLVTGTKNEESLNSVHNANEEEKCYRTITTQTSLEVDWSITIKTEITHHRLRPKLENLNCSVQLTPATSDEDIFYSPIGSPQDFHAIFHPVPLVKGSTTEDKTPTPTEVKQPESTSSERVTSIPQKKQSLNHTSTNNYNNSNKFNHYYSHYQNGKYRNNRNNRS